MFILEEEGCSLKEGKEGLLKEENPFVKKKSRVVTERGRDRVTKEEKVFGGQEEMEKEEVVSCIFGLFAVLLVVLRVCVYQ